jgi:uncharacterized protein (TIGR02996 family)
MPRFVLGDAFWQIEHVETQLIITSGSVGSAGKEQIRRYKTAGHAEIQYDVLIREKAAAGFVLTAEIPEIAAGDDDPTRFAALEAAITDNPFDPSAYAVYGDWLQGRGDLRGELIALQLAEDAKPGDRQLVATIGNFLEKHRPVFLGPLTRYAGKVRDFTEGPLIWRFGFIHAAQLDRIDTDEPLAEILDEIIQHPSGRFLAVIALHDDDPKDVSSLVKLLTSSAPASLRVFELTSQADCGDLGPLLRAHPKLHRLAVRGRLGNVQLAPSRETIRSIAAAQLPELAELELRFMSIESSFSDLRPLLQRTDLPALSRLRLRSADFADEIIDALVGGPLAAQITMLDLGLSELGDHAIRQLVANRSRFAKLRELVVTRGELSKSTLADLTGVKVTTVVYDPDDQRADEYFDGVRE